MLNLVSALAMIYVVTGILECNINFKSKKIYIVLLIVTLYSFFAYFITKSVLRIVILFQIYNICYFYLYSSEENTFSKITVASLMGFLNLVISEVIVALGISVISVLFKTDINYFNQVAGYVVVITFIGISKIKQYKKFLIKLTKIQHNSRDIIIWALYILVIILTTLYLIYFDLGRLFKFVLLLLSFIEYLYLAILIIKNYTTKEEIQKRLSLMIEVTSKYEKVISDVRIKNHENKNQLIVIKDFIGVDDAKAIKYIDTMINNKYDDDVELITKVANVPTGGLRGLIYYKLLTMKSKNIYCCLETSKDINKNVFDKIELQTLQCFYKIVGVLIDNSIDAVLDNNKKIILIELFIEDDNLIFKVSNEYNNKIDFEKLGKWRFSTKGEGHGYGLQLVRELVNSNEDIFNQTEIVGNLFIQKVGIKIKG